MNSPVALTVNSGLVVLAALLAYVCSLFALLLFIFLTNSTWRLLGAFAMAAGIVSSSFVILASLSAAYRSDALSVALSWDAANLRLAISLMTVACAVVSRT